MELPLVTFKGFLKQIDGEKLGALERAALHAGLPHFWSYASVEESVVRSRARALLGASADDRAQDAFTPQTVPNRRFSGGDLPRQRYFTISEDAVGGDNMTLASEMRAYRSVRRSVLCTVVDTLYGLNRSFAEAFAIAENEPPCLLLVFWGGPELNNPFLEELDLRFNVKCRYPANAHPLHEGCAAVVKIPYRVVEVQIPRVFDLRSMTTQEWLFQTICAEGGHCEVRVTFDDPRADFAHLLPWLMTMELGGSGFTEGIGHFLRRNGTHALIYPSARNDSFAIHFNGGLVKSAGWCMVDYRDAPLPAETRALIEVCDQTPFPFGDGTRIVNFPGEETRGSWATEGVRQLYRYRFYKELENVVGVEKSSILRRALLGIEGGLKDFERFALSFRGSI